MISFDAAHVAVHYPPDRRFRIWIRPSFLIAAIVLVLLPVLAAWMSFSFSAFLIFHLSRNLSR